jgi:hypothetical protein
MTMLILTSFLKWLEDHHQITLVCQDRPVPVDQLRTLVNRFNRRPAGSYVS